MRIFLLLFYVLLSLSVFAQTPHSGTPAVNDTTGVNNPHYDAALAEQLGADNYGMKSYLLVILKTGTNTDTVAAAQQSAFRGHMQNISELAEAGKLILAGPLGKNQHGYRGILILNTSDQKTARQWLRGDTAIQQGYLGFELLPWYGSAALPMYLEAADKIWKEKP